MIFGSILGHFRAQIWPIWRRFWVQKWPKLAQNSLKWPQTTPKMVRNDVGTFLGKSISGHFGIILGSFWSHFGVILGHFGSFWVMLGHFGSFWAQKMTKCCLQKPNMTPKPPSWPEKWLKIAFFSFCMENTHFYEFCHHGFQNGLKTSIFDENRSILAQIKAKTMLLHVVQSASLSRFYRKHYLPSNLLENRKSWNPSVNSATVIVGAKMAVKDENLNVCKLADSQNPLSALQIWCF